STAFRTLSQARHIGKIVVIPKQAAAIRADGVYLITGGLGGLGMEVARFLSGAGAGHIVLCGRGPLLPGKRQEVRELEQHGSRVTIARVDVACREEVAALLKSLPPLAGVLHLAGVVHDEVIQNLRVEHLAEGLAAKTEGARHLDELTRDMALDFFVMFS